MVIKRHSHAPELENLPLLVQASRQKCSWAWVLYGIALVSYLVIRLIVWKNTTILEDHDSISYLESIEVFLTWEANRVWHLNPDAAPLYPFFGALFSLPGWSVEIGARLCSLVFSVVLAVAIIGIGQRFASVSAIGLGLFIMAINASLIPLSFSVLTEPVFIAVAYVGLWLFWRQYENPAKAQGLLLGALFGLSFLARTEGIIFLVAIPFLQLAHFVFFRRSHYAFKHLMVWLLCFAATFIVISLPQIWRVSEMMGRFAINGRQAWELILNKPDGKSYEAKIYGLDYSPQQLNLAYIQSHPETLAEFESSISVLQFVKTIVRNFNDLYQRQLGLLIGPLGMTFFAFGILGLFAQGRFYETFLVLAFIGMTLIAPLVHDVEIRHIAIIGPLMMLIEGVGILYVSRLIFSFTGKDEAREKAWLRKGLTPALAGLLLVCHAYPLWQTIRSPRANYEYSPDAFKDPLAIVKKEFPLDGERIPRIVARKAFFAYMAGAQQFFIPFTDCQGLIKYCRLNDIDYLWLEDHLVQNYPFLPSFKVDLREFECLFRGVDDFGHSIQLYRFNKTVFATEETARQELTR